MQSITRELFLQFKIVLTKKNILDGPCPNDCAAVRNVCGSSFSVVLDNAFEWSVILMRIVFWFTIWTMVFITLFLQMKM